MQSISYAELRELEERYRALAYGGTGDAYKDFFAEQFYRMVVDEVAEREAK